MTDLPASPSSPAPQNTRFASQNHTAEDVLKEHTVGLVHLSDFRKRRAEALEQTERAGTPGSGATSDDGHEPAAKAVFKKRRKPIRKGGLSFVGEEDSAAPLTDSDDSASALKKKLQPNLSVGFQPKAMTKSALLREAQLKEHLRKEFLLVQEAVKQTDFAIPFVFYDGTNAPGGVCRMKKGDQIWLFLERARKLGAGLAGKGDRSKKDWARISVDDLMIVKGELIIPHHYEFYQLIVNRACGHNGPLFLYSAEPTTATPPQLVPTDPSRAAISPPEEEENLSSCLLTAAQRKEQGVVQLIPDSALEGHNDDPSLTRVVDRRWYEQNKHIYPASMWEEYDPTRDYSKGGRKDAEGNAFFFAR